MMTPFSSKKVVCFDLDDTLYKEKDFLISAYSEVAAYAAHYGNATYDMIYNTLLESYKNNNNPFQKINFLYRIEQPITNYLQIYRNHKPVISLSREVKDVLMKLKERDCILGLITDGRSITQLNKIEALGLNSFISDENMIISERFGSEKPSIRNFLYFTNKYPHSQYTYIGDNPQKDFIAPNLLNWMSICLLDDGNNIHKQEFHSMPLSYLPSKTIRCITEILDIIL